MSKIILNQPGNFLLIAVNFFFLFTTNTSFSQWLPVGTTSNLGSWPSVFVYDQNNIFIAGGATGPVIWSSTNGGVNFSQLQTNGLPNSNSNRFLTCVFATGINTIYAGDGSTTGNGIVSNAKIYKTTNGGLNWTIILSSGTNVNGFINGIVFSRTNPLLGVANCDPNSTTESFKMWKTTNGGTNWTLFQPNAPNSSGAQNSVFLIDENFFGFGLNTASARVAITTNGGANFNFYNLAGAGGSNGFVSSVAFNDNKLNGLAGTDATTDTIPRTTNGGLNWFAQHIPCSITGFCCVKWVPGTNSAYVVVSNTVSTQCFKTTDNGANWIVITFPSGVANVKHQNVYVANSNDATNQAYFFAVNSTGNVYSLLDNPLPVQLTSFTCNSSGRDVQLKWITSQEQNNYGFEIYRIPFAQYQNGMDNWEDAGFMKGKGTTNSQTIYNFTDKKLNLGIYRYRLKQIDFNGNYEYFNLNRSIEINNPSGYYLSQNYPNPFRQITKIEFAVPDLNKNSEKIFSDNTEFDVSKSEIHLNVYDMLGRQVKTIVNSTLNAGYYEVTINANELSSGIYFYVLKTDGYTEMKKMLVVK